MDVALIDVDGYNFPNLVMMKLSAYHKKLGDCVEWYDPLLNNKIYDICYMSKVFTFTPDYQYPINAKIIKKGGTGYFYPNGGEPLPDEIEHIYPDYSIYYERIPAVKNTAYGFLTRGCPRGCDFCIVKDKEGRCSHKVADLSEFWNGQPNINLLDPNMFACKDWRDLAKQLINSKAWIDFSQGCDIRIMTEEMANVIKQMKIKMIHFAWDKYEDKKIIIPKLELFKRVTNWDHRKMIVYVLTNFNTTLDQDLERVYTLRELGYWPYITVYDFDKLPKDHVIKKLRRYVNNRFIFENVKSFDEYQKQQSQTDPLQPELF